MDMFFIVLLVIFGVLFLVAEVVLLPGVSIGALLSIACNGSAIYLAFRDFGIGAGVVVIVIIAALSLVATIFSLRAKTWQRFSLRQEITSTSATSPSKELKVGARGVTRSRLAPMGKVEIEGQVYEAKSLGDYVDPQCEVEVVGFENFNIIVKTVK